MVCENDFCIYWANDCCILNEISLNTLGCCQECIRVDIPETVLQAEREKILKRFEQE